MAEKNFLLYGFWSLESKLSKKGTFSRVGAPMRGEKCGAKNFRILEQTQGGGVFAACFLRFWKIFGGIFDVRGGVASKSVVNLKVSRFLASEKS